MTDTPETDPKMSDLVREALSQVNFPGYDRDIVTMGVVGDIRACSGVVVVEMHAKTPDTKKKQTLFRDAQKAISKVPGVTSIKLQEVSGAAAPQAGAAAPASGHSHGPAGGPPGPGKGRGGPQNIKGVKRIIAVASGKGGVGKSTVSTNLACAMAQLGHKVGLMVSDVYGPSIPIMMGVEGKTVKEGPDRTIVPLEAHGVKVVSIGFLLGKDAPVIWRGPLVSQVVQTFLHQVMWDELDVLVVDMPPGTGDAQLTLVQSVPLTGGVIVTTPQPVALGDVQRGIQMFKQVEVPVLGIIENMSGYDCPECNHHVDIFSRGGGRTAAKTYDVPFLGEVPIDPFIREDSDAGIPTVIAHPDSLLSERMLEIAALLIEQTEPIGA